MSLFWILFLAIAVSGFLEIFFDRKEKLGRILLIINLALITLMLCFRYGEGSDYPTYEYMYGGLSNESFLGFVRYKSASPLEPSYYFLAWLFASRGVPFAVYVAVIAICEAPLLYSFLDRYCKGYRCLSLLLLYPVYVFTYQLSGLREGIAIALFLGALLPLLEKKKWLFYYLMALVCFSFHRAAVIYFLLPLVYVIKVKLAEIIAVTGVAVGTVYAVFLYFSGSARNISISSCALRAIFLVFFYIINRRIVFQEFEGLIYRIICIGMGGYFLLSSRPLIASRCFDSIRFADILLIVFFIRTLGKKAIYVFSLVIIVYLGALLGKNLDARCRSGMKPFVNTFNYPYITIFNKDRLYDYYAGGKQ